MATSFCWPQRRGFHQAGAAGSRRPEPLVRGTGVVARASLASYPLPRREGMAADWFQGAVRDVVRRLDDSPFLQLVSLGGGRQASASYPVDDAVVAAPEVRAAWRVQARGLQGAAGKA